MWMTRRIKEFTVYALAFVVVATFLYWIEMPNGPIVSTLRPLGRVLEVKGCNSGKYSLNCTVRTSTHIWVTDITDWPGNVIQIGDELAYRFDETKSAQEQWVCRNGVCRQKSRSYCWNWSPCAKPKT